MTEQQKLLLYLLPYIGCVIGLLYVFYDRFYRKKDIDDRAVENLFYTKIALLNRAKNDYYPIGEYITVYSFRRKRNDL